MVTRTAVAPEDLAVAAVRMVIGQGLAHARLGAAGQWSGTTLFASHWETSRALSPSVSALIGSILRRDDQGVTSLPAQADRLGLEPALVRDLLPVLGEALGPLERILPDATFHAEARPSGIPTVPDPLGLVYGIATLVGAGRLIESRPGQPAPTAALTASITRSTSPSVMLDPLGRQTPRA